jgi:hypothetical protein
VPVVGSAVVGVIVQGLYAFLDRFDAIFGPFLHGLYAFLDRFDALVDAFLDLVCLVLVPSMMSLVGSGLGGVWPAGLETMYCNERVAFVRLAYLMTGRRDVAEELVQEAFLSCAPRWEAIERPPPATATPSPSGRRPAARTARPVGDA